jgi:hypothetical protein
MAEDREKRFVSGTRQLCRDGFLCSETGKPKTQDHWVSYAECLGSVFRVSDCLGCCGRGMWKLTVMMRRVIYKMTTGLQFFRCAVVILQPEQVREHWHGRTPNRCCYNNWPLVDGVVWCVRRKKIPEKQGAGLPLASSSTLRSCLRRDRAFLTRRNHLSEPARWADLNLRFSLIPMSTPPTPGPGNLQIAPLFSDWLSS